MTSAQDASAPRVLRYAGDRITSLVDDVTGVDLRQCAARQALGQRVLGEVREAVRVAPSRASAIWFASPDAPGVLRVIEGAAEAARVPGVTEVATLLSPGDRTAPLRSTFDRGVYVRAVADTAENARAAAAAGAPKIMFVVESRHSSTAEI